MKTYSIPKGICCLIIFVIILLSSVGSQSQYVITFKDRTEVTAYIKYQTKDTLKYYLKSQPQVVFVETMDNIYKITPVESVKGHIPDSLMNDPDYQKYLHYKRITNSGIVIMSIGAVIGGIGAIGIASTHDEGDLSNPDSFAGPFFSALAVGLGSGLFITGIIKTISGSVKMKEYKEKMHGFSFDFNYTPQVKGVSLLYRF